MKKHEMHPYYFRIRAGSQGVWIVELLDKDLNAMGIASHEQQPLRFYAEEDARRHAERKGLSPAPF